MTSTIEELMELNTEPMTHESNINKLCDQPPTSLDDLVDHKDRWWDDDSDPEYHERDMGILSQAEESHQEHWSADVLDYHPKSIFTE